MILRIKQYFEARLIVTINTSQADIEHKLNLASAALMVEMIHADENVHKNEDIKIRELLQQQFDLKNDEVEELLKLALEKKHEAIDYHQFTSLINDHYSQDQKIKLVEMLWQIAYADNTIDKFEEHLVRKLAELLHVPHKHFVQARHRAEDKRE
jgi:uncharacterized tellurite resistance protein B-like protein